MKTFGYLSFSDPSSVFGFFFYLVPWYVVIVDCTISYDITGYLGIKEFSCQSNYISQ